MERENTIKYSLCNLYRLLELSQPRQPKLKGLFAVQKRVAANLSFPFLPHKQILLLLLVMYKAN